jgi:hypothetical protein
LFEIDEESKPLCNKKADIFYHIVSKLLYVSKQARLDIDLVVALLCTQVTKSTEQDWEKLRQLLQYLRGTKDMTRIVGANRLEVMQTWVDASYVVHADMRGQNGKRSISQQIFKTKIEHKKFNRGRSGRH